MLRASSTAGLLFAVACSRAGSGTSLALVLCWQLLQAILLRQIYSFTKQGLASQPAVSVAAGAAEPRLPAGGCDRGPGTRSAAAGASFTFSVQPFECTLPGLTVHELARPSGKDIRLLAFLHNPSLPFCATLDRPRDADVSLSCIPALLRGFLSLAQVPIVIIAEDGVTSLRYYVSVTRDLPSNMTDKAAPASEPSAEENLLAGSPLAAIFGNITKVHAHIDVGKPYQTVYVFTK